MKREQNSSDEDTGAVDFDKVGISFTADATLDERRCQNDLASLLECCIGIKKEPNLLFAYHHMMSTPSFAGSDLDY